jgi:hypothetical protein
MNRPYGDNCVGLRFPPGENCRDRDRDRGRNHSYQHARTPQFNSIGLQYIPTIGDVDIYRTVVIDCLPMETKLEDILQHATEHPIVSSQRIDMSKMKVKGATSGVVGTVAVILQFSFQSSADQFVFDLSLTAPCPIPGRVTHLTTSPTYPVPHDMKAYIGRGLSRRLRIKPPRHVKPSQFENMLEGHSKGFREEGWITEIKKTKGGFLEVTFNSIRCAIYALERMLDCREFDGCEPKFVRDYGEAESKENKEKGEEENEEKSGNETAHLEGESGELIGESSCDKPYAITFQGNIEDGRIFDATPGQDGGGE